MLYPSLWCMSLEATKAQNSGYVETRSALHGIAAGELKSAENAVGGWRNYFEMGTKYFELPQCFTKSTIRFEWCNSHFKFPSGFLPVSKRLFHEHEKCGHMESGTSGNRQIVSLQEEMMQQPLDSLGWQCWRSLSATARKVQNRSLLFKLINQSPKMYTAPLQDPYSEALPTQVKRKRTVFEFKLVRLRTSTIWEAPQIWDQPVPGCWTNHWKETSLHCCRAGELDHQIPWCTAASTKKWEGG